MIVQIGTDAFQPPFSGSHTRRKTSFGTAEGRYHGKLMNLVQINVSDLLKSVLDVGTGTGMR